MSFHNNSAFPTSLSSSSSTFSTNMMNTEDMNRNIQLKNDDLTDSVDECRKGYSSPTEIYNKFYKDKLADLKKELQQLRDGTHNDYLKQLQILKHQKENQLILNSLWQSSAKEAIERDFIKECDLANKVFKDSNNELIKYYTVILNERKRNIQPNYLIKELTPYPAEPCTLNNSVVPVPPKNYHKPSSVSISYLLQDHEIKDDIKAIQETFASIPTSTEATTNSEMVNISTIKKPGFSSTGNSSPKLFQIHNTKGISSTNIRIQDGKLLFEKRWYHRGQPIFVEGRQMAKFPAIISSIGHGIIWVKKTLDNSKFHINLSYLSNGKMSIKRRAVA